MDLHGRPRSRCSHVIFFIESAGFRYLFWLAEVDIFDLINRLLHGSLPARQAHHQDVTARRPRSFVFRAGVGLFPLPVAQRDNLRSARCLNQMHRLRSVSCLAFCTVGRPQELRGVSAYPYVARFPDISVFKDAQDDVRGIASVLPPKKQSVLIDPRYTLLMLRPQLGHAIRRMLLVLIRPPVVCEQDFGAPGPIDWVLVGNIYKDSLQYCALGDRYDGPCADPAFSFDGWPSESKVYWEQLCSSAWLCLSRLCVLHVWCTLGWQRFVVQSVNWVILFLVQVVGAPTVEMCAMQERDTSGFAGGAHGFSHFDLVFFFLMSVFAGESNVSSNTLLR